MTEHQDLNHELEDTDIKSSIFSQTSVETRRSKKSRRKYWKGRMKTTSNRQSESKIITDENTPTVDMDDLFNNTDLDEKDDKNSENIDLENDNDIITENSTDLAADVLNETDDLNDIIKQINLGINNEEDTQNETLETDKNIGNTLESRFDFNEFDLNDELNILDGKMSTAPEENLSNYEQQTSIGETSENEAEMNTGHLQLNTTYLSKDSRTYGIENFGKSAMVIYNHYEIEGYDKPRDGTHKDVEALKDTFGKLGFVINDHNDLTKNDINFTLQEFSSCDFTDFGCVAVVVLTHGSEGGYLRAKDRSYHESLIIDHFFNKNNPSLITKPKIFIFQACRGMKVSQAQIVGRSAIQRDTANESQIYTLPTEADVLILHSTYAGNAAHRVATEGSWFIQTLCKHINTLADTMDLEAIMTEVKKDVAINKMHEFHNRRTGKTDMNKQMPVVMSTLIRKLYLKTQGKESEIDFETPINAEPITVEQNRDERSPTFPKQHFIYMRNALRVFHFNFGDNSTATTGQLLLNIANSMDENVVPENTMNTTAKEISEYLKSSATEWKYFDLIFFFKSDS